MTTAPVTNAKEAVDRLRQALPSLQETFGVRSIGVFGSVARGEAGPDSDADILVDLAKPISYFDLLDLEDIVSAHLGRRADVHTRAGLRDAVLATVERDLLLA